MGAKTQNGGPHLLVLYWRAGGNTPWSKIMGLVAEIAVKTRGGPSWLTQTTETIGVL
jgi:hypothetical protein